MWGPASDPVTLEPGMGPCSVGCRAGRSVGKLRPRCSQDVKFPGSMSWEVLEAWRCADEGVQSAVRFPRYVLSSSNLGIKMRKTSLDTRFTQTSGPWRQWDPYRNLNWAHRLGNFWFWVHVSLVVTTLKHTANYSDVTLLFAQCCLRELLRGVSLLGFLLTRLLGRKLCVLEHNLFQINLWTLVRKIGLKNMISLLSVSRGRNTGSERPDRFVFTVSPDGVGGKVLGATTELFFSLEICFISTLSSDVWRLLFVLISWCLKGNFSM